MIERRPPQERDQRTPGSGARERVLVLVVLVALWIVGDAMSDAFGWPWIALGLLNGAFVCLVVAVWLRRRS